MLAPLAAGAQSWPSKPVTLIIPAPPGGNFDISGRIVGERLRTIFDKPFVNESKPGAGGMIAAEFVAKAEPDGHTLLVSGNLLLFSPLILGQARYDWKKDLAVVGAISFTPMVLEVHPSIPAQNLRELLDLAGRQQLSMSAPGAGTSNHLAGEMLQKRSGKKWLIVQYKGNAPATQDLLGGHVNFAFDQLSSSLPHVQAGRLRPIAVTSLKRVPSLPDVPTLDEAGIAGFEAETFSAIFAPAATPKPVLDRLGAELAKVLQEPEVKERFGKLGSEVRAIEREAFAGYLTKLEDTWVPLIKEANIKAE
jgi:tripartite-type tricarboxylate transporter receptor subunit TctC